MIWISITVHGVNLSMEHHYVSLWIIIITYITDQCNISMINNVVFGFEKLN
jgi:hypothetical protein